MVRVSIVSTARSDRSTYADPHGKIVWWHLLHVELRKFEGHPVVMASAWEIASTTCTHIMNYGLYAIS